MGKGLLERKGEGIIKREGVIRKNSGKVGRDYLKEREKGLFERKEEGIPERKGDVFRKYYVWEKRLLLKYHIYIVFGPG